jgi:Glucose-6-phosphate dehydrogenase, C-terminal domain
VAPKLDPAHRDHHGGGLRRRRPRLLTVLGAAEQPYERILADALAGDPTHFARMDNLEEAWRIVGPALDMQTTPLPYPVGSWGPPAADKLPGETGWQSLPDPPDHRPSAIANPTKEPR